MTYDKRFVIATGERAVGVFSATLSGALFVNGLDLSCVDWSTGLNVAGGAALLSILTSFVKAQVGPPGPGLTETTRGAAPSDDPDTVDTDGGAGRIEAP